MDVKSAKQWYKSLSETPEFHAEELKLDFANSIEKMMTRRDVNKAELARRISSSPAYISKLLSGDANVTIETMAKLTESIDCIVHIKVFSKSSNVRWFETIEGSNKNQKDAKVAAQYWQRSKGQLTHG